jgi:vacuolar protein sorting-associated protein 13A/C
MKEVDKIEKLRKDKENLGKFKSYQKKSSNFISIFLENKNKIEETNDTFSARMKLQILQNLELSIHNIHIVYEDKTTKPNHPFAFGITLNSMTFHVKIDLQKTFKSLLNF